MFSDAVYGGKEQSRKAARKYRREAMGDLPPRTTLTGGQRNQGMAKPAATKPAMKQPSAKKTSAPSAVSAKKRSRR